MGIFSNTLFFPLSDTHTHTHTSLSTSVIILPLLKADIFRLLRNFEKVLEKEEERRNIFYGRDIQISSPPFVQ